MKGRYLSIFVLILLSHCSLRASADDSYGSPGKWDVEVLRMEWQDSARQREIPAKIYLPKTLKVVPTSLPESTSAKMPVIIFSHGLGGTRDGYEYLGRHWASHGLMSVHLQHVGSDDSAWKGKRRPLEGMREAVADPLNAVHRPRDISFAIDHLTELNNSAGVLKGRLDLESIGVAGHSFGAYTVLAVSGQSAGPLSTRDPRIKAGIAMSAPVINGGRGANFDGIVIPLLHFTGTHDESVILRIGSPADRRIPFDRINGPAQYLVIFTGGDHMLFGGRRARENDAPMLQAIQAGTTAFWSAYLRDNSEAREWLNKTNTNGYAKVLDKMATYEMKPGNR